MFRSVAKPGHPVPPHNTPVVGSLATVPVGVRSVADLGRLVRQRRKLTRVSQQEFADFAGVGRRFLSELENGKDTLEIGKVLIVVAVAGIDLLARPR
jgi:y4mF family transcriptional regulator